MFGSVAIDTAVYLAGRTPSAVMRCWDAKGTDALKPTMRREGFVLGTSAAAIAVADKFAEKLLDKRIPFEVGKMHVPEFLLQGAKIESNPFGTLVRNFFGKDVLRVTTLNHGVKFFDVIERRGQQFLMDNLLRKHWAMEVALVLTPVLMVEWLSRKMTGYNLSGIMNHTREAAAAASVPLEDKTAERPPITPTLIKARFWDMLYPRFQAVSADRLARVTTAANPFARSQVAAAPVRFNAHAVANTF